jgi:competence ComEA-like helix-hairpin-helix protein
VSKKLFDLNTYRLYVVFATVLIFAGCSKLVTNERRSEIPLAATSENAVNINLASAEELQKIPRIGPKLAADIVEFRSKHGLFRRPEQLMLIDGISDERFREIRNYVRVE